MSFSNPRKRQSPLSLTDLASLLSPAKRFHKADGEESRNISDQLSNLPNRVTKEILSYLDIRDFCSLSSVNKRLGTACLSFLMSDKSVSMTFPMFQPVNSLDGLNVNNRILNVLGKFYITKSLGKTKKCFLMLGKAFKRMTCLMDTESRVRLVCDFLARIDIPLIADQGFVLSRQILTWFGALFHMLLAGWSDSDCSEAAKILIIYMKKFKLEGIMLPSYDIGSCPGIEIFYKHFFNIIFHKEVSAHQCQIGWLEQLMTSVCYDAKATAKVLLLMATPCKEDISHHQFGVQWSDHVEAIPANLQVAKSRYSKLILLCQLYKETRYKELLPEVLLVMFTTPSPWLPENIGSVLLLLGPGVTAQYLRYLCHGCVNCLNKSVTAAIVGLAIMCLRFNQSFEELVFTRIEEVLEMVEDELRDGLIHAMWKGFADEVTDLKWAASQGEDWAQEGGKYLYSAIAKLGMLMMKKAIGGTPRNDNEP